MIEWQIFWSIEPPLADRLEIAIGTLCSLLANIHRDDKKRPEPFSPSDFIVDWPKRLDEPGEDDDQPPPGLAPEHVFGVMEGLLRHQERRLKNGG